MELTHASDMETTYKIVDQTDENGKRSGIFLRYKIIAVVAVVVLLVVITVVLLAAFLGPGRKRSSSEECNSSRAKPQTSAGKGEV